MADKPAPKTEKTSGRDETEKSVAESSKAMEDAVYALTHGKDGKPVPIEVK